MESPKNSRWRTTERFVELQVRNGAAAWPKDVALSKTKGLGLLIFEELFFNIQCPPKILGDKLM